MLHSEDPHAPRAVSLDLPVVTPTDEDIPIGDAAKLADVSTKTVRRAVQGGHLPRRYAHGPRGLELVFWRPDVERWDRGRSHHRRRSPQQQQPSAHGIGRRGDQAATIGLLLAADRQDVLCALASFRSELIDLSTRINALMAALGGGTPALDEASVGEQVTPGRL